MSTRLMFANSVMTLGLSPSRPQALNAIGGRRILVLARGRETNVFHIHEETPMCKQPLMITR